MTSLILLAVLAQPLELTAPKLTVDKKTHEQALYAALVSYDSALQPGEMERLNTFQKTDARQALKHLGAEYVKRYPQSEHALEVKFNIARAWYEDGDFEQAGALLEAFALANPKHPDAVHAADLALDALDQLNDCHSVGEAGAAFLKEPQLPAEFRARVKRIVDDAATGDCSLINWVSHPDQGDLLEVILKTAEEKKGTPAGESALYKAISLTTDRQDLRQRDEFAQRLLREYPKSESAAAILQVMANDAIAGARFGDAAKHYEDLGGRFSDSAGVDAWLASARLKAALGDLPGAVKSFEAAAALGGARRGEVLDALAQLWLKSREFPKARATAEQALKLDRTDAAAAAVVAEVMASDAAAKPEALIAILTPVTNGPRAGGDDSARALWFLGDLLFRRFQQLPADPLEDKAAAMQQAQAVFLQAAAMGSAEWTVASLWRVGGGLEHLADALDALSPPAGLPANQVAEWRAQIKKNVTELRQQADVAFDRCSSRSKELDVFSVAAIGCRARSEQAVSPLRPLPAVRPVNVEELQKTAQTKRDAASFEALGLAYLGAWRVKEAQLVLGRAIEVDPQRASAHSALGYALLLDGDAPGAFNEYSLALKADPTYAKARANLGALRCRYGEKDGAHAELSMIKGTAVSGSDLDPEWSTCH